MRNYVNEFKQASDDDARANIKTTHYEGVDGERSEEERNVGRHRIKKILHNFDVCRLKFDVLP